MEQESFEDAEVARLLNDTLHWQTTDNGSGDDPGSHPLSN